MEPGLNDAQEKNELELSRQVELHAGGFHLPVNFPVRRQ